MARQGKRGQKQTAPIIRKVEAGAEGHHGGAWKVAYADFVTAMMAFFLVMWLLNATTEDQRKGLADYFSPNNLMSHASSGTGQPFGGHTVFDEGALVSDRGAAQAIAGTRPVAQEEPADPPPDGQDSDNKPSSGRRDPTGDTASSPGAGSAGAGQATTAARSNPADQPSKAAAPATPADQAAARAKAEEQAAIEQKRFQEAAAEIRDQIAHDPALASLAAQIAVDITPAGLRVQLLDREQEAMFATGSAVPNDRTRLLISKLVPVLAKLPEPVSIEGHTDAAPYPGPDRTNWELSAERANAARRMLTESGLADGRIHEVTGRADRDLLLPDQPLAAANRRIAITVLRTADVTGGAGP